MYLVFNMKGSASQAIVIWLFFLVIAFVIVLGYTTMSRVLTSGIIEDVEQISDINESSSATGVISANKGVWTYWPYFALIAFLLWAIFASGGGG